MDTALQGITVIIIAHRFATLQRVDRIALLRNGAIEVEGTHDDLLESNAYYHDLCEKQYFRQ
jgi:ATP-binding cassette subfamily B protein